MEKWKKKNYENENKKAKKPKFKQFHCGHKKIRMGDC